MKEQAKEYCKQFQMSTKDMENILRSMTIECIDIDQESIKDYLEDYDNRNINIRVSKNTQRILSNLKEGRETYEDVILRVATPKETLKVGHVNFQIQTPDEPFEVVQKGFVDLSTITDENPRIMFYDKDDKIMNLPRPNPHEIDTPEFKVWEETMKNWIMDDHFTMHIWEFKDKDTEIIGDDYILVINEGED
jgi:hypothetical protein